MSTCPEKDIHSIYLDNELPATYAAEYEAHVKSCPNCQAELNKIKALHQAFSADCKNITLTPEAMEASFKRFQARLSYSKVTDKNINLFTMLKDRSSYKTIIGFAAAAAIIAVILPVRINSKSSHNAMQFQPVARTKLQSPANAKVKVDGTLNTTSLTSLFKNTSGKKSNEASNISSVIGVPVSTVQSSNEYYASPIFQGSSSDNESLTSTLTGYDIFCPISEDSGTSLLSQPNAQEVTIRFNSEFGQIYLKIGNAK